MLTQSQDLIHVNILSFLDTEGSVSTRRIDLGGHFLKPLLNYSVGKECGQ